MKSCDLIKLLKTMTVIARKQAAYIEFHGNKIRYSCPDRYEHTITVDDELGTGLVDYAELLAVLPLVAGDVKLDGTNVNGINISSLPMDVVFNQAQGTAVTEFTLDADALMSAIKKASVFMSAKDVRKVLEGVFFDFNTEAVVGCDGERLYVQENVLPRLTGVGFTINGSAIKALLKIKMAAQVKITVTDIGLHFESGQHRFFAVATPGKYPDYRRVMVNDNADNVASFRITTTTLKPLAALIKAQKPDRRILRLTAADGKGRIEIAEVGIDIPATGTASTRINYDYLRDAVATCPHTDVVLYDTPVFGLASGDVKIIVMPCRG